MDEYIKKNISNLKPSTTLALNEKVKNLLNVKTKKKGFTLPTNNKLYPDDNFILKIV